MLSPQLPSSNLRNVWRDGAARLLVASETVRLRILLLNYPLSDAGLSRLLVSQVGRCVLRSFCPPLTLAVGLTVQLHGGKPDWNLQVMVKTNGQKYVAKLSDNGLVTFDDNM